MRYRQRASVEIEAIQWTGENFPDVAAFASPTTCDLYPYGMVVVIGEGGYPNDEGFIGDWLIRNHKHALSWASSEVFPGLYELGGMPGVIEWGGVLR
jgi:hypothetical protein